MTLLAVAVAGVGALSLLNLVFTLGVVRRLREHSERLANTGGPVTAPSDPLVAPVGGQVGAFSAAGTGGPVTDVDLADGTLVAFFSPSCRPCQEKLPGFVAHAADHPDARVRLLAVVVGDAEESRPMLDALAPVVPTVHEELDGPVGAAFAVRAFPASVRVGRTVDGRLLVTETGVWPRAAVAVAS
ncbi:redoxin domain-containing protein [Kitasatospora sp. NBC_00240]|uniref:peroxiredoxin family protein n=1 Tax=Kitasatospora sp. NBC_00240 TaxID=2903567 RepID=UPI00225158B6|nr:redoxin domain-containing protein [Kitasatospora sp. NBC_00240]MCX5207775.1 redoxin domain-containing protein [Kitasatospora sp. NBC_00240]